MVEATAVTLWVSDRHVVEKWMGGQVGERARLLLVVYVRARRRYLRWLKVGTAKVVPSARRRLLSVSGEVFWPKPWQTGAFCGRQVPPLVMVHAR